MLADLSPSTFATSFCWRPLAFLYRFRQFGIFFSFMRTNLLSQSIRVSSSNKREEIAERGNFYSKRVAAVIHVKQAGNAIADRQEHKKRPPAKVVSLIFRDSAIYFLLSITKVKCRIFSIQTQRNGEKNNDPWTKKLPWIKVVELWLRWYAIKGKCLKKQISLSFLFYDTA